MSKNKIRYTKIAPNFHLITNEVDQFKVSVKLLKNASGAYYEKKGEKGVYHLMEHCVASRTKDLDAEQLKQLLFEKDIYLNASTSPSFMEVYASGHKKHFKEIYSLVTEMLVTPTFDEEILAREKEIVCREIDQRLGNVNYRVQKLILESIYVKKSIEHLNVLGEIADVQKATLEQFKELFDRSNQKSHFVLYVNGGGFEYDELIKEVKNLAQKVPFNEKELVKLDFDSPEKLKKFKYMPIVSDLGQDAASLTVGIPTKVTFENRALRSYLRELLFTSPIGYLYNLLRDETKLVYSLGFQFDHSSQILLLYLVCEIDKAPLVVKLIKETFENFEKIFTPEKISVVKDIFVQREEINQDDPEFLSNYLMDMLLGYAQTQSYNEYIEISKSVSFEDLKEYFKQFSENFSKSQIIVFSNKEEVKNLKFDL